MAGFGDDGFEILGLFDRGFGAPVTDWTGVWLVRPGERTALLEDMLPVFWDGQNPLLSSWWFMPVSSAFISGGSGFVHPQHRMFMWVCFFELPQLFLLGYFLGS